MRNADGPMSTPRRLPPRSSGTPMMCTDFTIAPDAPPAIPSAILQSCNPAIEFPALPSSKSHGDRHALARWCHDAREQRGVILDRGEEIAHFGLLVHHVVRQEQAARPQAREHEIEEALVVLLPRVEKDELELALDLRDFPERVAGDDGDDVGEPRPADVVGGLLRARRIVLDRGQVSAGLSQPQADPDRAVSVRPRRFRGRSVRRSSRPARGGIGRLVPRPRADRCRRL